ncbi:hypothetical protein B0H13DRAFT_2373012 [Mycena leptocephala]|nr:hypothetical protein B0H13DRAFT_2373012 [Mycena leptocephala]
MLVANTLTPTCRSFGAGDKISNIALDSCVGNVNGDFHVGIGFTGSDHCTNPTLEVGEKVLLGATCPCEGGFNIGSHLDLVPPDTILVANDGVLACAR